MEIGAAVRACRTALALRPAGLVTDLDGTLSPIVADPADARVTDACREALAALAARLECTAVLSGRAPEVARSMVRVEGVEYLGAHGLAHWTPNGPAIHPDAARFIPMVAQLAVQLRQRLPWPGIIIEEKGPALAVHYRQAPDPEAARRLLRQELGGLAAQGGLALAEGRMVFELRPPPPLGKGSALRALAQENRLASVVYLGDDRTDLEAFEALRGWRAEAPGRRGVALAVASEEMPPALAHAADYVLDGIPAVEQLLRQLVQYLT